MREISPFEPWFFILFGLFHLHRVWGLLDREDYAAFWLGVLTERGAFYWALMAVLGGHWRCSSGGSGIGAGGGGPISSAADMCCLTCLPSRRSCPSGDVC